MSYLTIAILKQDPWIRDRVTACLAVEGHPSPETWVMEHAWALAAQPGWASAWESALAANPDAPDYEPGRDQAVITDAQILSAVQSLTAGGGS